MYIAKRGIKIDISCRTPDQVLTVGLPKISCKQQVAIVSRDSGIMVGNHFCFYQETVFVDSRMGLIHRLKFSVLFMDDGYTKASIWWIYDYDPYKGN